MALPPGEFTGWRDLWRAIEHRCLLAGLEASAPRFSAQFKRWGDGAPDKREVNVFVEVRRSLDRRWKRGLRDWRNKFLASCYESGD